MERFGVPSGGDWSLYRGGALHLEGTENVTLQDGLYKRLDGNAIFLSVRTVRRGSQPATSQPLPAALCGCAVLCLRCVA